MKVEKVELVRFQHAVRFGSGMHTSLSAKDADMSIDGGTLTIKAGGAEALVPLTNVLQVTPAKAKPSK